jgi:DNA-binding beta-propeller fold protein YncE
MIDARWWLLGLSLVLAGCGAAAGSGVPHASLRDGVPPLAAAQNLYLSAFSLPPKPQLEITNVPLHQGSRVISIFGDAANKLACTNAMRVRGARLALLTLARCDPSNPTMLQIFKLPLQPGDKLSVSIELQQADFPRHMALDRDGDLWVSSDFNNYVLRYHGPFKNSGIQAPARKINDGIYNPEGLGVDLQDNLYVANFGSGDGSNAIAVFKSPPKGEPAYFLDGVPYPRGLGFDGRGDLFVFSDGMPPSVDEFYSTNLGPGATPDVIDIAGLETYADGEDIVFDSAGNMYVADCDRFDPGVLTYPMAQQTFSPTLVPTRFGPAEIQPDRCVASVALYPQ